MCILLFNWWLIFLRFHGKSTQIEHVPNRLLYSFSLSSELLCWWWPIKDVNIKWMYLKKNIFSCNGLAIMHRVFWGFTRIIGNRDCSLFLLLAKNLICSPDVLFGSFFRFDGIKRSIAIACSFLLSSTNMPWS